MFEGYQDAVDAAKKQFIATEADTTTPELYVCQSLANLLHATSWDKEQWDFFHAWMKKLDIAKKHYETYNNNWKPTHEKVALNESSYQLSVLIASRCFMEVSTDNDAASHALKISNVLFKTLDRVDDVFGVSKEEIIKPLVQYFEVFKKNIQQVSNVISEETLPKTTVKTLPVTVLFSEGPIARAYLETIKGMGLKVNKIIKLVSSVDLVSKKPIASWMPKSLKINYAASKQFNQMFYWPAQLKAKHADHVGQIHQEVIKQLGFKAESLNNTTVHCDLAQYTTHVETLLVNGLRDPMLRDVMLKESDQLFLFTGGGIVPDNLLNIDGKKLIHVHPGFLPDIRGADCVLWSQLLTNHTSASAFYLAPGIDVGDVILPCWLPQLNLSLPNNDDLRLRYRLIYGFLDPWVRSFVLKQMLITTQGLTKIDTKAQKETDGMTFHFMHDKLKELAFKQFSKEEQ